MNDMYIQEVTTLLEKAFLQLEEGNWKKADIILSQVLDIQPKNPHAYFGKLMIDLKIKTEQELIYSQKSFEDNINYQRAIRFGDHNLIHKLEHAKKENIYYRAKKLIDSKKIVSHRKYVKICEELESINKNKGPNQMIDTFKNLELVSKKRNIKRLTFAAIIVIISAIVMVITNNYIIPHIKYQKTLAMYDEKYQNGLKLYNDDKFDEAKKCFDEILHYKESRKYSKKCVNNLVNDSSAVEFLHNINAALTYKEFVELYGNISKEEIRQADTNIMPYSWKYNGGFIVNDVIEYAIGTEEVIFSVFFWGTEKISEDHNSLLGQEAYVGGHFFMPNYNFAMYSDEIERAQNKENAILHNLYFRTEKEVSKEYFEKLVSYISTYEGKYISIEYLDDKYEVKWESEKYGVYLTYTLKDNMLKYGKVFA